MVRGNFFQGGVYECRHIASSELGCWHVGDEDVETTEQVLAVWGKV